MNAWDFAIYLPGLTVTAVAETRGAWLLFAPENVVKILKPTKREGRDLTTIPERQKALKEELELMKQFSPGIAESVVPLKNQDAVVEVALLMKRIPRSANLLARLIAKRGTDEEAAQVGKALAKLHAKGAVPAKAIPVIDSVALVRAIDLVVDPLLLPDAGIFLAHTVATHIRERLHDQLHALAPFLKERARRKRVRRVHGNLHAANVYALPDSVAFFNPVPAGDGSVDDPLSDAASIAKDLRVFSGDAQADAFLRAYAGGALSPEERQLVEVYEILWTLRHFLTHIETLSSGSGGLVDTELVQRYRRRLSLFSSSHLRSSVTPSTHAVEKRHRDAESPAASKAGAQPKQTAMKKPAAKREAKPAKAPSAKKPAPRSPAKPAAKPAAKTAAKPAKLVKPVKRVPAPKRAPNKPLAKKKQAPARKLSSAKKKAVPAKKPSAAARSSKKKAPAGFQQKLRSFLGLKSKKR